MIRFVTIERFAVISGYTVSAIRSKIKEGVWLEGKVCRKAPDGRILIDRKEYERWVLAGNEGASAQLPRRRPRSTSTTAVRAVANG